MAATIGNAFEAGGLGTRARTGDTVVRASAAILAEFTDSIAAD
jgi:hypothetical protein